MVVHSTPQRRDVSRALATPDGRFGSLWRRVHRSCHLVHSFVHALISCISSVLSFRLSSVWRVCACVCACVSSGLMGEGWATSLRRYRLHCRILQAYACSTWSFITTRNVRPPAQPTPSPPPASNGPQRPPQGHSATAPLHHNMDVSRVESQRIEAAALL